MSHELEQLNREQLSSETDPFSEGRYRQFAKYLGADFTGRVLDVGCNTGRGGQVFIRHASKAVLDGVEMLSERIERIPTGVYQNVYRGLLADMPQDARPYDALLMGELIEHVPLGDFEEFLGDVIDLLAPSGQLLLTTPNPHYLMLRRRSSGSVLGGAHVSVHCPVALRQFLAWKGLEVRLVTGSGRMSGILGEKLPMFLYGSYLLIASKPQK